MFTQNSAVTANNAKATSFKYILAFPLKRFGQHSHHTCLTCLYLLENPFESFEPPLFSPITATHVVSPL
uniref:Uncharacterized protein n=1 Tax=Anguilla anguilla TaxID=7936 RepID=A0A0E9PFE4_ANGAN